MTKRVETGPMKIGDDWTGIFIRGDNALAFALTLRNLLAMANERAKNGQVDSVEAIYWAQIDGLAELLESCREK